VLDKLDQLPKTMSESGRKAHQYENAIVNLVEAAVLHKHVGQTFTGVVVQVDEEDPRKGDVVVQEPAVEGSVTSAKDLPLGTVVRLRLVEADVTTRKVRFELA
jgi:exoribonuclease R